jgi:hypothetical protein
LPGALRLDQTRAVSQQLFAFFLLAEFYDGKGPWLDYQSHFDACSEINHWSDKEKGLYLAVSLRGQAQGVLGKLPLSRMSPSINESINCSLAKVSRTSFGVVG